MTFRAAVVGVASAFAETVDQSHQTQYDFWPRIDGSLSPPRKLRSLPISEETVSNRNRRLGGVDAERNLKEDADYAAGQATHLKNVAEHEGQHDLAVIFGLCVKNLEHIFKHANIAGAEDVYDANIIVLNITRAATIVALIPKSEEFQLVYRYLASLMRSIADQVFANMQGQDGQEEAEWSAQLQPIVTLSKDLAGIITSFKDLNDESLNKNMEDLLDAVYGLAQKKRIKEAENIGKAQDAINDCANAIAKNGIDDAGGDSDVSDTGDAVSDIRRIAMTLAWRIAPTSVSKKGK